MPWEVIMSNLVGPWVRRFLVEYVIGERNYTPNTQHSYRDTFRLFLPFVARRCRCPIDRLALAAITPKVVRAFLAQLEQARHCGPSTLNQRLAALRAWSGFVGLNSPEHLEWSHGIRAIQFKKHTSTPRQYLEKEEVKALLAAPDRREACGFRDHALLLFLYNTGARVSEAAQLRVGDLDLVRTMATLHGKGRKVRRCPLWKITARALEELVAGRAVEQAVFVSQRGGPLTRYGIHTMVERYTRRAAVVQPSLSTKRVSPHIIRHATAMDLLRSGVDINTIRVWLGHASLTSTNIYAESDLEMKAKALARCEAPLLQTVRKRSAPKGVMGFLNAV
jgi:site-specific recombinase XerD